MKIPLNWLSDYVKINKSPREIADSFTALGLMLDKPLQEGKVLDLEHRMDRSDWLSIVGCARDLAAFENEKLTLSKLYTKPLKTPSAKDLIPVTVQCQDVIRRFTTRVFRGVKVTKSPSWLVERLESYGIKSINNIVDITNYVMVELGQPLHAQDLQKLPARELTWRYAKEGEKLLTFLGSELTLTNDMFVMTSKDEPIVLGGIVGGLKTGVTETTTDFILDAGNYDQKSIRRTSRKLHINNETVLRSDKFLDPRATEIALSRATELILKLAGGTCYLNTDYYPSPATSKTMTLRLSRLYLLSGINFPLAKVKRILAALDYQIVEQTDNSLTVEIPYFRTDIEVEDDLVADILRISDYKNIPTKPLTTPTPPDITSQLYRFEDRLRNILVSLGADEHITSSLVEKDQSPNRVVLENALTSEASALRLSVLENLAPVLDYYKKHNLTNVALFELGLAFSRHSPSPTYQSFQEHRQLSLICDQDARPYLSALMSELGILYDVVLKDEKYIIAHANEALGELTLHSFTLDTNKLLKLAKTYHGVVSEFSQTKSVDISLTLNNKTTYTEIKKVIQKTSKDILRISVIEHHNQNLLLRLTWHAKVDYLKEKDKILKNLLRELKVSSRSVTE